MNTHVIIPIADIEKQIKSLKKQLEEEKAKSYPDNSQIEYLTHEIDFLERLSRTPTKISLDEKDIEKKAAIAMTGRYDLKDTNNQIGAGGFISGYKQALNELL